MVKTCAMCYEEFEEENRGEEDEYLDAICNSCHRQILRDNTPITRGINRDQNNIPDMAC
ncbi:MAG: hypothetical protein GY861_24215 [bacterium]|nr:hypothetical protein [bacterium]